MTLGDVEAADRAIGINFLSVQASQADDDLERLDDLDRKPVKQKDQAARKRDKAEQGDKMPEEGRRKA